jgi:hypothetical protein
VSRWGARSRSLLTPFVAPSARRARSGRGWTIVIGMVSVAVLATFQVLTSAWAAGIPGFTWSQLSSSSSPSARGGASMDFDLASWKLVLFGGENFTSHFNDTWTWNGRTWTQVDDSSDPGCSTACASSPSPRTDATMAYDPATGNLVLFGGSTGTNDLNDTWAWNGRTWTQVDDGSDPGCSIACTLSPPNRAEASMAYDPATGSLVLFGGNNASGDLNDTWTWNGSTWTQVDDSGDPGCSTACTLSPSGRAQASMDFDLASWNLVLFGGTSLVSNFNDTWTWNGRTWTQVDDSSDPGCSTACTSSPAVRHAASMAFNLASLNVVLFGGSNASGERNDTWTWNGRTWTQVDDSSDPGCSTACPLSPPIRADASMAFDLASLKVVLFGGGYSSGHYFLSDTWSWGLNL